MKTVIKNALMKSYLAPSVTAARNRVASNLGSGRLTVIAYHQVKEPADDGSSVTPASFRQQMQYLREHYDVVPLKYAVKRLGRGQVRRRFVSITFDDGYLDNATAAAPIMREAGLSVEDVSGLMYEPWRNAARLVARTDVNYLVCARKPDIAWDAD